MKRLFPLILIAFLAGQAALAQKPWEEDERLEPRFRVGIKAGVNIASVTSFVLSESYLGFHGGVFGHLEVNKGFDLGAEINYSNQGVIIATEDLVLKYVQVPLVVNLLDGPVIIQVGGYGALLVKATKEVAFGKTDQSGSFQNTDTGLLVGMCFYPTGITFLGVRYNLGLQNINNQFAQPPNTELYNRNFQISAGIKF